MTVAGVAFILLARTPLPQTASLVFFWLGGLALLAALSLRATPDRLLASVVVASHLVRSALAVVLFEVSALALPVFRTLQFGDGFWIFSPDSSYYHQYARWVAIALGAGMEIPRSTGAPEYPLFVALIYWAFGVHPLYPVFVQILAVGVSVLLAAALARELWGARGSRITAVLIAFWPSLILWSTQLLKDSLCILLIVAFLFGFHRFQFATRKERFAWAVELIVTVGLLYRLRFYFVLVLVAAAALVCAAKALFKLSRRAYAEVLAHVLLMGALVFTFALSASLNREWFGQPSDAPGVARRLAAMMLSIGEIEGASWQLGSAVTVSTGALPGTREYEIGVQTELGKLLALATSAAPGTPEYEVALQTALAKLAKRGQGASERVQLGRREPRSQKPFVSLEEAEFVANTISRISTLDSIRRSFINYGGASNIDKGVRYDGVLSVIRYLPKAMLNATLTPNPFIRFDAVGPTGGLRSFSAVEVALIAGLLVLAARGFVRAWPIAPELVACLALFSLMLITLLGLVVPTVGLLFRFRLGFVIPLCIIAGGPALWQRARPREKMKSGRFPEALGRLDGRDGQLGRWQRWRRDA